MKTKPKHRAVKKGRVPPPWMRAAAASNVGLGATPASTVPGPQMTPAGVPGYANGGRNFIRRAIKHPGAFRAKARAAGEPTGEYAQEHQHDSGTTGKQARLALTLMRMRGK